MTVIGTTRRWLPPLLALLAGLSAGCTRPAGVIAVPVAVDLRQLEGEEGQVAETVVAAGSRTAGDGGGGIFLFAPTGTAPDDGGTVLQPASRRGRWVRQDTGPRNVRWWGARGDDRSDDTAAIQAAVDCVEAAGGGTVFFPPGEYVITDSIRVGASRVRLSGGMVGQAISRGTTLRSTSTDRDLIRVEAVREAISGFEVERLNLLGNPRGTAGAGLHVLSAPGKAVYHVVLRDLAASGFPGCGVHLDASRGFIFHVTLDGGELTSCGQEGLRLEGAVGQLLSTNLYSHANRQWQVELAGHPGAPGDDCLFLRTTAATAGEHFGGIRAEYANNIGFYGMHAEDNTTYEAVLLSCRGVIFDGGTLSQGPTSLGICIGSADGKYACRNIRIDVPGWTNRSPHPRIDLARFGGGTSAPIYLGTHADGAFAPGDVAGYPDAGRPAARRAVVFTAGRNGSD
jgi:hypothetical protein